MVPTFLEDDHARNNNIIPDSQSYMTRNGMIDISSCTRRSWRPSISIHRYCYRKHTLRRFRPTWSWITVGKTKPKLISGQKVRQQNNEYIDFLPGDGQVCQGRIVESIFFYGPNIPIRWPCTEQQYYSGQAWLETRTGLIEISSCTRRSWRPSISIHRDRYYRKLSLQWSRPTWS